MIDIEVHLETLAQDPVHEEALEAVETAYGKGERWEELLRLYEANSLNAMEDDAARLLVRASTICLEKMGSSQRAEAYLEQALARYPSSIDALRSLREIAQARSDYENAIDFYQREIRITKEPQAKATGWLEIASWLQEKIGNLGRALGALNEAAQAAPDDARVQGQLASIYIIQNRLVDAFGALKQELRITSYDDDVLRQLGELALRLAEYPIHHELADEAVSLILEKRDDDELALSVQESLTAYRDSWETKALDLKSQAEALENAEGNETETERLGSLWFEYGQIQKVYGRDNKEALEAAERVLSLIPSHRIALGVYVELMESEERYDELSSRLEDMAAYARDRDLAIELLEQAALLRVSRLGQPEASVRLFRRILDLDPTNGSANYALTEYFIDTKQWSEAIRVFQDWLERSTAAEDKVAAHYGIAAILDGHHNDLMRARKHYESVLKYESEHRKALLALEPIYREANEPHQLAGVLNSKLSFCSADEHRAILEELGELYSGDLDNPAEALAVFGELFQASPTVDGCERLEELAAQVEEFSGLSRILEASLPNATGRHEQIQILHSLGTIYESQRESPIDALRVFRKILVLSPYDSRATEGYERLLEAASESQNRIEFFQEQLSEAGSNGERVTLLHKLADELLASFKNDLRAIDIYRSLLKIEPNDRLANDRIQDLYRREGRWPEIVDMMESELRHTADAKSRAQLHLELGQILEGHLEKVELACEHYCNALDDARDISGGGEGQVSEAIDGLERLLSLTENPTRLANYLQPCYVKREHWEGVADILELRIHHSNDHEANIRLLNELATVYEYRLERYRDALGALLRAFQAEPMAVQLRPEIVRLAKRAGDFTGVIRAYRSCGHLLEAHVRDELIMQAGVLAESDGDYSGAVRDYLRSVLVNEEYAKRAEEGFKRMLEMGLDPHFIIRTASQVGTEAEKETQLSARLKRVSKFMEEQADEGEVALKGWKEIRDLNPSDPEAELNIERLLKSIGEPSEYLEHLQEKLEAAIEDPEKVALQQEIAGVFLEQLDDQASAIESLEAAVELQPGQRSIWTKLAGLYGEMEDINGVATAMEHELKLLSDKDERSKCLLEYAKLLGIRLRDYDGALRTLNDVLAESPNDEVALDLLRQLFEQCEESEWNTRLRSALIDGYKAAELWDRLIAFLQEELLKETDPGGKARILRDIAEVKSTHLKDSSAAVDALLTAFDSSPSIELTEQIENVAEGVGDWERILKAYQEILQGDDRGALNELAYRIGDILNLKLQRPKEAAGYYQEGLEFEFPAEESLMARVESLFRQLDDTEGLVTYLEGSLKSGLEGQKRVDALKEVAGLLFSSLEREDEALEYYRELLCLEQTGIEVLRPLEEILRAKDRHEEHLEILDRLIEMGYSNPEFLEDYMRKARALEALSREDEAFKTYRSALLKKREFAPAIEGLESLAEKGLHILEIAQALEPIYTARQDHHKLADILLKRVEVTENRPKRKALLRRVGDIYENRLDNKLQAFKMARQSLKEDPTDMGVRMWIEKLATDAQAFGELALAYVEEASKCDDAVALQLHRRAAGLYFDQLEEYSEAAVQYRAILGLRPTDEKSKDGLDRCYRELEAWAELVGLLKDRLPKVSGITQRAELLQEIAELEWTELDRPEDALEHFLELYSLTPQSLEVERKVDEMYRSLAQWSELGKFYERAIEYLDRHPHVDEGGRKEELKYRYASILFEELDNKDASTALFTEILEANAEHHPSVAFLERYGAKGHSGVDALLEKLYSWKGHWQNLLDLLEASLDSCLDLSFRAQLHERIAKIYEEELQLIEPAVAALRRCFVESPTDDHALNIFEEMASRNDRWAEFVDGVVEVLDGQRDPIIRQRLLKRVAKISAEELGDVDDAIGYYHQAIENQPEDLGAISSLEMLAAREEKWDHLVEALTARLRIASTDSVRIGCLERLGQVLEESLEQPKRALEYYQQIRDIEPGNLVALVEMERLFRSLQAWEAVVDNLGEQGTYFREPHELVRIHTERAQVLNEFLDDPEGCHQEWLLVIGLEPLHEEANSAIEDYYESKSMWEPLAEHLETKLGHSLDSQHRTDAHRRLGRLYRNHLEWNDQALAAWQQVHEFNPKDLEALRSLLELYKEYSRWGDVSRIANEIIPLVKLEDANALRLLVAEVQFDKLSDSVLAKEAGEVILDAHSSDTAVLARLNKLFLRMDDFNNASSTELQLLEFEEEDEGKISRYYSLADLYLLRLDKPEQARNCYELILEIDDGDLKAFASLRELYRSSQLWPELRELDEEFVHRVADSERYDVLVEIRDVLIDRLSEPDIGFIAACRVYREEPSSLAAAEILEKIALSINSAEEAAAVLEDENEKVEDRSIRVQLLLQIGRLYAEEVQDTPAAEEVYQRVLALDELNHRALDMLSRLAAGEDRFDKQLAALEKKILIVEDPQEKKEILFQIGRIWRDEVEDTDNAVAVYQRILAIDPEELRALDALSSLYEAEGLYAELVLILSREVEFVEDPEREVVLRVKIAKLCEEHLEDHPEAIKWYNTALELTESNVEALEGLERLYQVSEQWAALIRILEEGIKHISLPASQLNKLHTIALVYEHKLENLRDAAACHERCLQLDAGNKESLAELERLLREMGDWKRLVVILQHHLKVLSSNTERSEIYLRLGHIYHQELSRGDLAEQSYNSALKLEPSNSEALLELANLYERSGNWFQAMEILQQQLEHTENDSLKLPILMRIGTIQKDMLLELPEARESFLEAVSIEPEYAPALRILKEIAEAEEDWEAYERHLLAQGATTENSNAKAALWLEAGRFYDQNKEDDDRAIVYYERSLEINPGYLEACRELAEIYFRNENWPEAGVCYRRVLDSISPERDVRDFAQKNYRLGLINDKLGHPEHSVEYYQRAVDVDPHYLMALEALTQSLITLEEWADAKLATQQILKDHADVLTISEQVEFYAVLGDLCRNLDEPDEARAAFSAGLALDSNYGPALKALAELELERENFGNAVEYLSRYVHVAQLVERCAIHEQIGALRFEKLSDIPGSVVSYEHASHLENATYETFENLANRYLAAGKVDEAVEAMQKAIEKASERATVSELYFQLAQIFLQHVEHEPRAIECFNSALDAEPTNIKAFEAIEQLLTGRNEWTLLEENYRTMLTRAKQLTPAVRLILWRNLASLYTNVFDDVDNAIMAYEVVRQLDSSNQEDATTLASLYGRKPETRRKGVALYHQLIGSGSDFVGGVKALRRLYHAERDFDSVYACCGALHALKSVDEEEARIYNYLSQGLPAWPKRGLQEAQWASILHPDLGNSIGYLAAELYRAAPDFVTSPGKKLGLKRRDYVDMSSDLFFVGIVRRVMDLLNIHGVDLCRKKGALEPLHLLNAQPPVLVLGEKNEIFRSADQNHVRFVVGRMLAYARPELFLARIFGKKSFRAMLVGLCRVYNRDLHTGKGSVEIDEWTQRFDTMPDDVLRRLNTPSRQAYSDIIEGNLLEKYLQAVELTAARGGFVAAGSLSVALNGVNQATDGIIGLSAEIRTQDLLNYSMSQGYLALRKDSGACIRSEPGA